MAEEDDPDTRLEAYRRRGFSPIDPPLTEQMSAMDGLDTESEYLVVSVHAYPAEIFEERARQVKVGSRKVLKKQGLFNKEMAEVDEYIFETQIERIPTGKFYDTHIDKARLAKDIQEACNKMHQLGYVLLSQSEVISGRYAYKFVNDINFANRYAATGGFGYGYSVTDGVVLTFRKMRA